MYKEEVCKEAYLDVIREERKYKKRRQRMFKEMAEDGVSIISLHEVEKMKKETQKEFMGLSRRLKAYNICFPSGELTDREISLGQFYLAVRSIIYKQTRGSAPDEKL